jgi:TolB-like protein/DNA-binding winged helix-turn-helix (wHTH) protein/Flp pilus assembly protein TadD
MNRLKPIYRFGPFRLDTNEHVLLRETEVMPVGPKGYETLLALVEGRGHVVGRDELMKRVWPNSFVEDGNLAQQISFLRKALGDNHGGPHYIETVPRRGYRFVAEVQVETLAEADPALPAAEPVHVVPSVSSVRVAPRRHQWMVAAVVLCASLVALAIHYLPRLTATRGPAITSLAVLPLENISGDPAQDYLADGMTESIITDLAKIRDLRVISRSSVMQYRKSGKPLPKIAGELGVDAVVEGSVLRSGDRVRVTAELVRAANEQQIWAESYERDFKDVLALNSEVALRIARQIAIRVTPQERSLLEHASVVDPQAHESYLRGRYFWGKRTEEGYRKAIDHFNEATARDPMYAQAYAGLADSYVLLAAIGNATIPSAEALRHARAAAVRAIELDDSLAEAHTSLAQVMFYADWDWAGAAKEFQRALDLNPNYATAHHWYGYKLMLMGRFDEAARELRLAEQLDPLSLIILANSGFVSYSRRQYDNAIAQYRKVLEFDPNFAVAHGYLALAYEQQGKYEDAEREFHDAVRLSGGTPEYLAALAHTYAREGKAHKAKAAVAELNSLSKRMSVPAWSFALVSVGRGDTEETFAWLQKAYRDHSHYVLELKVDPRLDPVRSDPRFTELLQQVGLPSTFPTFSAVSTRPRL